MIPAFLWKNIRWMAPFPVKALWLSPSLPSRKRLLLQSFINKELSLQVYIDALLFFFFFLKKKDGNVMNHLAVLIVVWLSFAKRYFSKQEAVTASERESRVFFLNYFHFRKKKSFKDIRLGIENNCNVTWNSTSLQFFYCTEGELQIGSLKLLFSFSRL